MSSNYKRHSNRRKHINIEQNDNEIDNNNNNVDNNIDDNNNNNMIRSTRSNRLIKTFTDKIPTIQETATNAYVHSNTTTYDDISNDSSNITTPMKTRRKNTNNITDTSLSPLSSNNTSNSSSHKKRLLSNSKNNPFIDKPYIQPHHYKSVLGGIIEMRKNYDAPVDNAGGESNHDITAEPHIQRFQILITLLLSSQTPDPVTRQGTINLRNNIRGGLTVQSMLDASTDEIDQQIKSVGFHNRKAVYIKQCAEILHNQYNDDIPKTADELMNLPGIGPKMAYIIMSVAWGEHVGIGIDTHMHRILQRLEWVPKNDNPETTRMALQSWLPKEHWSMINKLIVGFGQQICTAKNPKCDTCLVVKWCNEGHKQIKQRKLDVDIEYNASLITKQDKQKAEHMVQSHDNSSSSDSSFKSVCDVEQII